MRSAHPNRAYPVSTPPPPCAQHSAWGDRFSLNQSGTVQMDCHNDTLHVQGEQVVNDGQTLTSRTLSCTSETAAMRCTNSSDEVHQLEHWPFLLHVTGFLPNRVTSLITGLPHR